MEWRARETRINRRFRSSREQGSNAAWLAFLGLPAARRKDDTYGRGHRNNTLREHDKGTRSTHSRGIPLEAPPPPRVVTRRGAARGKREREYWVHISFNTPTHPPGGQPSAHVFARELTGWRGYRVFEQALGLAEGHSPPHRLGEQEKQKNACTARVPGFYRVGKFRITGDPDL